MTPELEVIIGADIDRLVINLRKGESGVKSFETSVNRSTDKIDKEITNTGNVLQRFGSSANAIFSGLAAGIAASFSVGAIVNFTKSVFDITAQFQKFKAVLTNTLGSEAIASLKLKELQDFAAVTPFGVTELTDAFIKLSNQGFQPSITQIRQLGDLASSTGKSFDQLAEAILDAQTGEYERLKEFGIRAKDAGSTVIFTFKGVATEVDKTSSSIRDYITALGDAEGVSGSMAAISATLDGQISNLGDNYDSLLKTIGEGNSGVFSTAIGLLNDMIEKATEFNRVLNTQSKYNLTSSNLDDSWLPGWLQAANFISNRTSLTDSSPASMQAGLINNYTDELSKQNSEFISGAKYVSQYVSQLNKLKESYRTAVAGVTDVNLKNAIADQFLLAARQLGDAAKALDERRNKSADANFGGGKGAKSQGQKDAEDLAKALKRTNDEVLLAQYEGWDQETERARMKYEDLRNQAKGNSEALVQIAATEAIDLANIDKKWMGKKEEDDKKLTDTIKKNSEEVFISQLSTWDQETERARLKYEKLYEAAKGNSELIVQIAQWEATELAGIDKRELTRQSNDRDKEAENQRRTQQKWVEEQAYYANLYGDVIGNVFDRVLMDGDNVFKALGDEFKRMVVRMIADAAALEGAKLFGKLLGIGVSAVTGGSSGSFLGSLLKIGGKLLGFASGGIVSGPTLGMIGEYAGASSNPEVIAPLSDLRKYIGSGGSSTTVQLVMRRGDLYAMVKEEERANERLYGGQ